MSCAGLNGLNCRHYGGRSGCGAATEHRGGHVDQPPGTADAALALMLS